jgi:hypothetical protein
MLVKLSLFALYYRLFALASTLTRRLVYVGSVLVILFYPSLSFMVVGLCAPRRGKDVVQAHESWRCKSLDGSRFHIMSAFNVASDVYLVVLPVRNVWRLQMPRGRKVAVCALFLTGSL